MSRRCSLTGTGRMAGNQISHSNRKSKKFFLPNLSFYTFESPTLGSLKLKITQRTKRTILNKYGTIDDFLVGFRTSKLTEVGVNLKRKLVRVAKNKGIELPKVNKNTKIIQKIQK